MTESPSTVSSPDPATVTHLANPSQGHARIAKSEAHTIRRQQEAQTAAELVGKLPNNLQRAPKVDLASSCLSTLLMTEHGFALHKGAFWDALCLRYGWRPSNVPTNCIRMWETLLCGTRTELCLWQSPIYPS